MKKLKSWRHAWAARLAKMANAMPTSIDRLPNPWWRNAATDADKTVSEIEKKPASR